MSDSSDSAESCPRTVDKGSTYDAELKSNPPRQLPGHTAQEYANATVLDPRGNRNSHGDEDGPGIGFEESNVQAQIRESNVQAQIRESNVQVREIQERNSQTQVKPGPSTSHPKRNDVVNRNWNRWNEQPMNKLTKGATKPASYTESPQVSWVSSLFPASFAPPTIFPPPHENGRREMTDSNELLHKIQRPDPQLGHFSVHTVCASDCSRENQQTSPKVLPKSHKQGKRRKQAVGSHDRVAAMETLTESSTLSPHVYYPTRHAVFPKLESSDLQDLHNYSNYSMFPHRPNNYAWMFNQNAAFYSTNISKSALEIQNIPTTKAVPASIQQKPLSGSSCSKTKKKESTNANHIEHGKTAQVIEETKCTTTIKSEPCFPTTKMNTGTPTENLSAHLPHFSSPSDSLFGKSRMASPLRVFDGKSENGASNSDFCEIVPKKKRLSSDENVNILWKTSSQATISEHTFHSPNHSSPQSLKNISASPASILPLPSPLTPGSTTPSWQVGPSNSETALIPEQALGNQQSPFILPQLNISDISPVGQVVAREKDVFYCHMCTYSNKSKPEFEAHMKTHFEFNCPHCDYTSRTEGRLNRHIKDFHTENSARPQMLDRSKTFKCKQCTFSSTEKEKFWEHCRTHIKENKLLQCPHCVFVTEHKHHLEYHISNHFGSKPFKCGKCNYSCVNKSMLNSHLKSHTKIYPYRCADCTYATKYSHSLKLHLKKYNHKPAMALDQHGNLPKELCAKNWGLSVGNKSQCPTDQSDVRNDAINPYVRQILGMSGVPLGTPAVASSLNNMMPFWPVLPPTPIQSGMLAGSLFFNHLMGVDAANKIGSKMQGEAKHTTTNENGEINSRTDIKNHVCTKCSLTFKSTEAWYHHMFQMHNDTASETTEYSDSNKKVSRISRNKLIRSSCMKDLKNHQPLHSLTEPNDQRDKLDKINSCSNMLSNVEQDHTNNQRAENAESPLPSYPDKSNCENKLEDMCKNVISKIKSDNIGDPANRAKTVQQVIVNCEPEIYSKILPSEQRVEEGKRNTQNAVSDFMNKFDAPCVSSDLLQQKVTTVFKSLDFPVTMDNDNTKSVEEHSGNEVKLPSKATALLPNMHMISDSENIVINKSISAEEITIPRKRPRKGKAYKIDLTCLKQRKLLSDSSSDEAKLKSVMGIAFDQDRSLRSSDEDMIVDGINITEIQGCTQNVTSSDSKNAAGENNLRLYDEKSKYLEVRNLENMVHQSYKQSNIEFSQNENINKKEIEIKKRNETKQDVEAFKYSGNDNLLYVESEVELQKLQSLLRNQSGQLKLFSKKSETYQADRQFVNISESANELRTGRHTKGNVAEVSSSNRMVSKNEDMIIHSEKVVDQLNEAEISNSVTDEKEKTVCSPVKKSTDLEWRMMKERVIPFPSELSPINSSSQTQTAMSSVVLQDSLPGLSMKVNNTSVINNNTKPLYVLPYFSDPNCFNSSQPSNPHIQNSAMLMKPLQVSSTPKAYIHPTNRATEEPSATPENTVNKQYAKKMFECKHCELSFGDCVMYTVHMGYHSKQNPFQCNNCGVVSQDRVEFFLHMARSSHV
ncbi:hypothetical protein BsWGS_14033 [Bradybaena similaris]